MHTITIDGKEYMPVSRAAKVLGIHHKTIYTQIYTRRLAFLEVLGHKVVCKEDIEKLMRHPKTAKVRK